MGFAAPFLLFFLIALPAIWWLLHVTPPAPTREIFPPLRLLLKIANHEETPNRTPWWLLLLRLLMVALVIFALADPIWRPATTVLSGNAPLALVIDNGWASVHDWDKRVDIALDLVNQAEKAKKTIYIAATADNDNQDIRALNSNEAEKLLHTMRPLSLPTHRRSVINKLAAALKGEKADIVYLSDGLQMVEDDEAFSPLMNLADRDILVYDRDISDLVGITSTKNDNGALAVDLIRAKGDGEKILSLGAYDGEGRMIAETETRFEDGETSTVSAFNLPVEMKNDIAAVKVNGQHDVAATYLSDARNHIYRVGLVSPSARELAEPLLSPFYYIEKALYGRADVLTTKGQSFEQAIKTLINFGHPSTIILDDVVNMPEVSQQQLNHFVEQGGTLIRFAGPNLASNDNEDILLPVKLRHGERQLGGVMSWATPQKLAPLPKTGIFSDLAYPEDVTVSRQILAEPSPELFDHTWLSLADGTPLVTARARGKGMLVFIHTSAGPTWSTLPLSGFFVEMMQKLVQTGELAQNVQFLSKGKENIVREPWQVIDSDGSLVPAPSTVAPLSLNDKTEALPSFNHPPGFYGQKNNLYAVNLLDKEDSFLPLNSEIFSGKVHLMDYSGDVEKHLGGLFLAFAIMLFALDTFITLYSGGLFASQKRFFRKTSFLMLGLCFTGAFILGQMGTPNPTFAEKLSANDAAMVQSAGKTRLAYVITGLDDIDDTSKNGLEALSQFLLTRTTIDPGPVAGLDLEQDELAFYPLIYWPIDAKSPMPSKAAIDKINAYMNEGGTVLFDTHDQIETGMDLNGKTTANNQRLRDILSGLNIPALEEVPPDHVIARSFYIMPDFPGRYRGSPLWILSSALGGNDKRPIHAGDGVSSILITANDFAGAWAHDGKGSWKYPLVPDDDMQRVWAFRGGLNIVMYVLTGNYKADQVHVPALLERLGQEKSR
ncbi:N-terminal double-transmembrane domain-containing protein [Bartonella apihabitans]|uniref:N-terminal double-transmembrane domain-containing protein n=1 Tax=Bartonella apihabitans TaxID=2750929 RepID=A0A1U9MCP1_9HYPH|nr:DUF4159 domain-containing protein [Bartonella apihabitans]AQT43103.1 N-terminal double-transmembrane domain-containing protein [Bartonella apihabitans]